MMKILSMTTLVLFSLISSYAIADTIVASCEFSPVGFGTHASGSAMIVEGEDGKHRVVLSDDFEMSSGIILDVQACGNLDGFSTWGDVCLSSGELTDKQSYPIKTALGTYYKVSIRDLEMGQERAVCPFN